MVLTRSFPLILSVLAGLPMGLAGCLANDGADLFEGDEAGECSDGADNDRDGSFDCDDADCARAPDCEGETGDDDDSSSGDDDDAPAVLQLVESIDHEYRWNCSETTMDGRTHCYSDYVSLAQESLESSLSVSDCGEEWALRFLGILNGEVQVESVGPLSVEGLAQAVEDTLGLGEWWTGLDARMTEVIEIERKEHPWGTNRTLYILDPLVGPNEVQEFRPAAPAAVPFVIVLPGHPDGDSAAEEMTNARHLIDYAEAGYGVLVIDTKGYDSDDAEHLASINLLCAGKSMMAVRAYEALLLHKYIRYLIKEGRAESRIGLLGNSGGSVAANMLTRFFYDFDAVVVDFHGRYIELGTCAASGPSDICLLDECHEGLYVLRDQINNDANPPVVVPTLSQEYGYIDGPEEVLDFLDAHLLE